MRDRPLPLLLVDPDPVFRLGLRVWLEQFEDLRVVADVDTGVAALAYLVDRTDTEAAPLTPPEALADDAAMQPIRLVIVNLQGTNPDGGLELGLTLCRQIKQLNQSPRVMILGDRREPVIQAAVQQAQADGYALRSLPVHELAAAIRRVAQGRSVWMELETPAALDPAAVDAAPPIAAPDPSSLPSVRSSWWRSLQRYLARQGLPQILAEIDQLRAQRSQPECSLLSQIVIDGRLRELRTALWCVQQLTGLTAADLQATAGDRPAAPPVTPEASRGMAFGSVPTAAALPDPAADPTVLPRELRRSPAESALQPIEALMVDAAFTRLQGSLRNLSDRPLEIDILRADRKRELLYLALRQMLTLMAELRQSQVQPSQLYDRRDELVSSLWQRTVTEFFGPYYRVAVATVDQVLVTELLQSATPVQTDILTNIPLLPDLWAHWLFQSPLMVDGQPQAVGTAAALRHAQMILDHALIQLANGVIQPLLNQFADVESIKRDFYDRRRLSTRDIERFRNDLSWYYRRDRWWEQPTAIFESRYRLLTLTGTGIQTQDCYAPRRDELMQLRGVPYLYTLALELRDAIAPRLRGVVSWFGSGVIYVLTDVVGRSIGLIGRGILQGMGSAWRDQRFSRNSERSR